MPDNKADRSMERVSSGLEGFAVSPVVLREALAKAVGSAKKPEAKIPPAKKPSLASKRHILNKGILEYDGDSQAKTEAASAEVEDGEEKKIPESSKKTTAKNDKGKINQKPSRLGDVLGRPEKSIGSVEGSNQSTRVLRSQKRAFEHKPETSIPMRAADDKVTVATTSKLEVDIDLDEFKPGVQLVKVKVESRVRSKPIKGGKAARRPVKVRLPVRAEDKGAWRRAPVMSESRRLRELKIKMREEKKLQSAETPNKKPAAMKEAGEIFPKLSPIEHVLKYSGTSNGSGEASSQPIRVLRSQRKALEYKPEALDERTINAADNKVDDTSTSKIGVDIDVDEMPTEAQPMKVEVESRVRGKPIKGGKAARRYVKFGPKKMPKGRGARVINPMSEARRLKELKLRERKMLRAAKEV